MHINLHHVLSENVAIIAERMYNSSHVVAPKKATAGISKNQLVV